MILIGFCGAGKSEVGKRCAHLLKKTHIDTDLVLEKQLQKRISEIYQEWGEEKFRWLEQDVLFRALEEQDVIISTGGGSILLEENRLRMKKKGSVIYLKASLETLFKRREGKWPQSFKSDLKNISSERFSYYESIADHIIETDHLSLDEVANQLF